jgi:protoporphyrinogen oxidase
VEKGVTILFENVFKKSIPMKRPSVVVLGAGVAGLSAAWKLSEAGVPVTVLERDSKVGGLSRTIEYKGFLFDYSAHRFNSDKPEIIEYFKRLVGKHLIRCEKKTYIHHWGRLITYPPRAKELLRVMPRWLVIRAGLEFLWATVVSCFHTPKHTSFAGWTRSKFGKTLSKHLNEKYAEKLWKMPSEELSGDWASTRIGSFRLRDFLFALFSNIGYRKIYSDSHPDSEFFYYTDRGIGYFPDRLAEEVVANGGKIVKEAEVTRIQKTTQGFEISYTHEGEQKSIQSQQVISTIPLHHLLQMITPPPPENVLSSVRSLRYLGVIIVNVLIDAPRVHDASWVYYPDPDVIFNYILEFRNWSPTMALANKTSLCVNVTAYVGDETWSMTDEQLIARVAEDLHKTNVVDKKLIFDGFVERLPYAYPVYDLQYRRKMDTVYSYLDVLPGLHLIGRTGGFKYINSDRAMEDGIEVANKIIRST